MEIKGVQGLVAKHADWNCPVCDVEIDRRPINGRPRVYCTNACRQKAYRWRRAHGVRTQAIKLAPLPKANRGLRSHALRPSDDFVSALQTGRREEVALCGAFARPARFTKSRVQTFHPERSQWACKSCTRLLGREPATAEECEEAFIRFAFNDPDLGELLWYRNPAIRMGLRKAG